MKLFKKQLFWTVLEIWIYDEKIDENDLENIFLFFNLKNIFFK